MLAARRDNELLAQQRSHSCLVSHNRRHIMVAEAHADGKHGPRIMGSAYVPCMQPALIRDKASQVTGAYKLAVDML